MNDVNETVVNEENVTVVNEEFEALKKEVEGLDRNQLKEKVENVSLENIFALSEFLFEEFKNESKKYLEKGRNNAALNSRKLTGKLETIFMVWRKKTIEAAKNKAE
jgi:hypothetical protein